jgi:hypothetical protein
MQDLVLAAQHCYGAIRLDKQLHQWAAHQVLQQHFHDASLIREA